MKLRERNKDYYPHGLHSHLARIGQTCGVCTIVLRQRRRAIRDNKRPHVESGQRRPNLPMVKPTKNSQQIAIVQVTENE